jgi:hypothetical protein
MAGAGAAAPEWTGEAVAELAKLREATECVRRLCSSTVVVPQPAIELLAVMMRRRPILWEDFVAGAPPSEQGNAVTVHRVVAAAVAVVMARGPSTATPEERVEEWATMPIPSAFDCFKTPHGAEAIVLALTDGTLTPEAAALLTPDGPPVYQPLITSMGPWGEPYETFVLNVANVICEANPGLYDHGALQGVRHDFAVPDERPPTPCVPAAPNGDSDVGIKLRLATLLMDGKFDDAKDRAELEITMPQLPGRDPTPFVLVPTGTVFTLISTRSTRPLHPTMTVPPEIAVLLRTVLSRCKLHLNPDPGVTVMRLLTQMLFTRTIRETLAAMSVDPLTIIFNDPTNRLYEHYVEMLLPSDVAVTMWCEYYTQFCTTITGIPLISMYEDPDTRSAYSVLLRRVLSELACICMTTRCELYDKFYCMSYNKLNPHVDLTALLDSGLHKKCNTSSMPLGIGNMCGFDYELHEYSATIDGESSPVANGYFDLLTGCEYVPDDDELEKTRHERFGGKSFLTTINEFLRYLHAEPVIYEACKILESAGIVGDILLKQLGYDEETNTFAAAAAAAVTIPRI